MNSCKHCIQSYQSADGQVRCRYTGKVITIVCQWFQRDPGSDDDKQESSYDGGRGD